MNPTPEQELEDRWLLGLRGLRLRSVELVDFSVALNFDDTAILTVEQAAEVRALGSGPRPAVVEHPGAPPEITSHLRALIGCIVLSAVAFKSGSIRLAFDNGNQFKIGPGDHYEPWQLTAPSGRFFVSVPGGGIEAFSPGCS